MEQEFKNINERLDDLIVFLSKNMVTKQEFEERLALVPTREDFHQLQISVDGIAKQFQEEKQERMVGATRVSRMEGWIIRAATKIGLEYKP